MSRLAHTTTHTRPTKAATATVMTAAVLILAAAALLLRSLDGSEVVLSARPDVRGAAITKPDPIRHDGTQSGEPLQPRARWRASGSPPPRGPRPR
jgi:hypothetical protein